MAYKIEFEVKNMQFSHRQNINVDKAPLNLQCWSSGGGEEGGGGGGEEENQLKLWGFGSTWRQLPTINNN